MPADLAKPAFDLGIVTADVEASLVFYRDLLGFPELMTLPVERGELTLLIAGEMMVKLMSIADAPTGPKGDIGDATGYRYLTFWVTNFDGLVDELRAAGVPIIREPFEVAGTTAVLVADPDGNVVEFLDHPRETA